MVTVKTTELFNLVTDMLENGFPFTSVGILEPDDEFDCPAALTFECPVDKYETVDYEELDDHTLPDDFDMENYPLSVKSDSYCMLPFTLQELTVLHNGMRNGLLLLQDNLSEKSLSADDRSKFSQMVKMYDPLITKIEAHFRTIGLKY